MDDGSLTPEQKEANRERNIRRIAENWAEHEAQTLELEELQRIATPSPSQLRRIAELVESLQGQASALPFWKAAADAGDSEAGEYLVKWEESLNDPIRGLFHRALPKPVEERREFDVDAALKKLAGEILMDSFDELLRQSSIGGGLTDEQKVAEDKQRRRDSWQEEIRGLNDISDPSPTQLRRIAELVENLEGGAAARPYWEQAAEAGDQDAKDVVELMNEEEGEKE